MNKIVFKGFDENEDIILSSSHVQIIEEENKINAKEFNNDLEEYFNKEYFNINETFLIEYYYHILINNPQEWVVISNITRPFENESIDMIFDIINLLRKNNYNFKRSYNKIKIL